MLEAEAPDLGAAHPAACAGTEGVAMLGPLIRAERLKRGWTQEQLARRVGLTQAAISQLERGRQPSTTARTLARMAEVLDVPLARLLAAAGKD